MIKFVCGCGKHLRARDDMARQRAICPRCGSMVGIPALQPTVAGGAAPMTPQERIQAARARKPSSADDTAAGPDAEPAAADGQRVRLFSERAKTRPRPSGRHLEKHWYECLLYPLRARRLCFGLALILTAFSAVLAMYLPFLVTAPSVEDPYPALGLYLTWAILIVWIIGLPCSFLDRVLASAAQGEVDYILWSGNPITSVFSAGVRWFACFLAGPAVLAVTACLYWMRSDESSIVDWVILSELSIIAVAYQIFALVTVADRDRLLDLNPLTVADLAHRLGWRALVVVLLASLGFLANGWLLLAGISGVHLGTFTGWLLLAGGWVLAVFWGTFFCRLLGVWCFRSRPAPTPEAKIPEPGHLRPSPGRPKGEREGVQTTRTITPPSPSS